MNRRDLLRSASASALLAACSSSDSQAVQASPDVRVRILLAFLSLRGERETHELTPTEARVNFEQSIRDGAILMESPETVASVKNMTALLPDISVKVRVYVPNGATTPLPVICHFHGGGWVVGGLDSYDRTCRALANRARCVVVAADYRRAPEARFPGPLDDCYAVAQWASAYSSSFGGIPGRIAVFGDSAGGNLAAAVALMARDRQGPRIVAQVMLYGAFDATLSQPSLNKFATGYMLTKANVQWYLGQYAAPEVDRRTPYLSPLFAADKSHLPPALVITAGFDPLHDEGEKYAAALTAAGVRTEYHNYPGMMHGFAVLTRLLPDARDAINRSARFIRTSFETTS